MSLMALRDITMTDLARRVPVIVNSSLTVGEQQIIHIACEDFEERSCLTSLLLGAIPSHYTVAGSVTIQGETVAPCPETHTWGALKTGFVALRKSQLRLTQTVAAQFSACLDKQSGIVSQELFLRLLDCFQLDEACLESYPHQLGPEIKGKIQVLSEMIKRPQLLIVDGLEVLSPFYRQPLVEQTVHAAHLLGMSIVFWHNDAKPLMAAPVSYALAKGRLMSLTH
ncbi:MAG: hypothetical protein HRU19_09715 [Pseudobacteriovorax sp.]|nr:hypothetical protein [Pseudobacteriovorax sp.]